MFTWSTTEHNFEDRFDAWTGAVSATHLPWRINSTDQVFSRAHIQSVDIGSATIVNCRCDPCAGFRDAKMARSGNDGFYGVLSLRKGRERVRQGGIACDLQPGDIMIWDSAQPIDFEIMEPLEKCTILLSKDQLTSITGASHLPIGCIATERGFGALFFSRLLSVSDLIEDFVSVDGERLESVLTWDLLNALGNPRANKILSPQQVLRERALRIMKARYKDQNFTPSLLAEEVNVSPRTLHKAFEEHHETVAGAIRMLRLQAVKSDLEKPELMRCSITRICFARGFSSPEHFSRTFRAEYGMSPRTYRRLNCAQFDA